MSEISSPEGFKNKSKAQSLDLNALADAFAAKGDHTNAQKFQALAQEEKLRQEQAQKNLPKTQEELYAQWQKEAEERAKQAIAQNKHILPPPPRLEERDWRFKTQRLDTASFDRAADELDAKGDHAGSQKIRVLAQRPSKPPVQRPGTK